MRRGILCVAVVAASFAGTAGAQASSSIGGAPIPLDIVKPVNVVLINGCAGLTRGQEVSAPPLHVCKFEPPSGYKISLDVVRIDGVVALRASEEGLRQRIDDLSVVVP